MSAKRSAGTAKKARRTRKDKGQVSVARYGKHLSYALCALIVLWTSWPALEMPRLEEDDYRYLDILQQLKKDDSADLLDALIVENRWDHLWFVQEKGRVRFFRPTIVLSYAVDWWIWGKRYAFGLTLTNVLLHLACSLLVVFLFFRWLGPGWPAIACSALFAGLWSHGECIFYVAGRTDSMAALGFLAALALHVAGDRRPSLRWWAIPCFAFGLLTKELAVAAPLVFFAYDRLVSGRHPTVKDLLRREWKLYAAYALAAGTILLVKQLALGGQSSDLVHPYFISPLEPGFLEHVWLQARSYAGNLILAEWTVPFADAAIVALVHSPAGILLGAALIGATALLAWRDGRFWFLLLLAVATWLPVSFVYVSERYLYLPSVACAGLLGLLVVKCPPKWHSVLSLLVGAYAVFHAVQLHGKLRTIVDQPGSVAEMAAQLEPVRGSIARGGHLLLVNEPGRLFRAQFAQAILRILLDDPALRVDVLTMMPGQDASPWRRGDPFVPAMGAGVQVRRSGPRRLILEGSPTPPGERPQHVQEYGFTPFAWSHLDRAAVYRTQDLEAHVLAGDAGGATKLEFVLPETLDRYQILVWEADGRDPTEHPWRRRKNATVRLAEHSLDRNLSALPGVVRSNGSRLPTEAPRQ